VGFIEETSMNGTADLLDLETWRAGLGLIAVPLRHGDADRFVMLNGSRGNFCLDLSGQSDPKFARNAAWSSDVGHYVEVLSDRVTVHRWDLSAMEARPFERESVASNLSEFQRLLERNDPDRERSVVRFVARMFGVVRNLMGSERTGLQAMEVFLVLLACALDQVSRETLATKRWDLDPRAIEGSLTIETSRWDSLLEEMRLGRPHEQLRPVFEFVLRHAAGQVFQEAHYLADFPHEDQLLLQGFLPSPARKRSNGSSGVGVYFTPPYLARTLAEQCVARLDLESDLTFFDPACGSGEILREVVRQLEYREYRRHLRLVGWDLSPIACEMARYVLAWEREHTGLSLETQIEQHDSMNEALWPSGVNAIVMNPPFVSYHRMTRENANMVSARLGTLSGRLPDLSTAFVYRAAEAVGQDGVIGTLLPASLLDNPSSAGIRSFIAEHFQPSLVAKLGDQTLFRGALVDAAMFVAKKTTAPTEGTALWADFTKEGLSQALRDLRRFNGAPIAQPSYSIYRIDETLRQSSWLPRPYEIRERLRRLAHLPEVQELFEIRQGIRSGDDDVFVVDPEAWQKVPRKERRFFRSATVNRSIRFGRITEPVHLFFPYGRAIIESESELEREVPWFYSNRLTKNKRRLERRKGIGENPWWTLTRQRLRESAPKFISTAFGRRGSFAWDASGNTLVLMGFAWHPRLSTRFPEMPREVAMAYLAILNSAFFDELLAGTSRHVGGGQWDLQNHYVKSMRLPNFFDEAFPMSWLRILSDIGTAIFAGASPGEAGWREAVEAAYYS
jgi:hypothetical protein